MLTVRMLAVRMLTVRILRVKMLAMGMMKVEMHVVGMLMGSSNHVPEKKMFTGKGKEHREAQWEVTRICGARGVKALGTLQSSL